ncbi:MAG: L-gulono,4-lactone dehydrogenase, partial [Thermoleophilaceae bacterium]|nr:L-gulono,4-lactone dehydrogenase [Thermoleophilaceae bacterium]
SRRGGSRSYAAAVPELWSNWAGDQRCAPSAVERPGSEEEVAAAIGRAAAADRPVRVAGAGHSFSDIVLTDGHLLHLGRMDRVLSADARTGLAEVEAGISLHDLGPALAEHGLALENQGDVDPQSVAGAISTATHGTGATFRNLSAQVAGLRLITAAAEAVDCSEEVEPDLFRAARVGLGALGVITRVTLRCAPLYTLRRTDAPRPLGETLDRLDDLVDGHERFELFVFPYTRTALTRTTESTADSPRPLSARAEWLHDVVLENRVLDLFMRAGRAAPRAIPACNRAIARLFQPSERVDRSYRIYANPREVRFTEMEYAVPRAAGREALERVLEMVEHRRLPISFPLEFRFVASDDAYLSPSHGRETAYIAVHVYRGMEHDTYFRAVESIMREYDGRPHWGKRHYRTAADLAPAYPDWDRFAEARERLDPDRRFRNDYVERVLGP